MPNRHVPSEAVATCVALITLGAAKRLQLGVRKRMRNEFLSNLERCIAAQTSEPSMITCVLAVKMTTTQIACRR